MLHRNKRELFAGGQRAVRAASRGLWLLAGLLLAATSCSTPGDVGVGLPDANANTGAYLIDTLTIRASTVLRDSVVTSGVSTSGTSNLLVGRYVDPELGTITAKSYFSLALGDAFQPDQQQLFDSLVLVLKPTTGAANAYRYGDTTKTQTLVEVYQLGSPISATKASYASPKLTPMPVIPGLLNQSRQTKQNVAPVLRARPNLATLRLPLRDLGQSLFEAAKKGQLATQDLLDARYPGLALLPGATDNASIVAFGATTSGAALILYYHDPTTPSTVASHEFPLSSSRHFYHVTADRATPNTLLTPLTTSLKTLPAAQTAQRTYIEGALGLVTKLEFPYLTDVSFFSSHPIVTSATITAEVPASTLTPGLAPPSGLAVFLTDQSNHLTARYPLENASSTAPYNGVAISNAGLERGIYSWSIQDYCQQVINRTIPNNGLILVSNVPDLPTRVVLGGPLNASSKLQLRLYFIGNGN